MSNGYTIDVPTTTTVAERMTTIGSIAATANLNLDNIGALPAPEAGESIGPGLKAFQTAWTTVFKEVKTEMDDLAAKAHGTVTTYAQVNSRTAAVINKMRQFEN